MIDICETKTLNGVIVQENGIVRNSRGRYLARLDDIEFDSDHLDDPIPQHQSKSGFRINELGKAAGAIKELMGFAKHKHESKRDKSL